MPRTIALDTVTGDFNFSGGTINFLEKGASIVQGCQLALQYFEGEWFLNPTGGLAYWQSILVKSPDPALVQVLMKNALLGVLGVTDVVELTLTLDGAARRASVKFRVDTDVGLLEGSTNL